MKKATGSHIRQVLLMSFRLRTSVSRAAKQCGLGIYITSSILLYLIIFEFCLYTRNTYKLAYVKLTTIVKLSVSSDLPFVF